MLLGKRSSLFLRLVLVVSEVKATTTNGTTLGSGWRGGGRLGEALGGGAAVLLGSLRLGRWTARRRAAACVAAGMECASVSEPCPNRRCSTSQPNSTTMARNTPAAIER